MQLPSNNGRSNSAPRRAPSEDDRCSGDEAPSQPQSDGPVGGGDYVVQQGDCISSIATAHGFFWETLWNHAENAELKRRRTDPNVLLEGDRVHIPELTIKEESGATEKRHRFRKKGEPAKLRLRLLDAQDRPRANLPYRLLIEGSWQEGTTDGDGKLEHSIPPHTREAVLDIRGEGSIPLTLGGLDPVSAISGVQQRLRNLGYDCGAGEGEWNEESRGAMKRFQESQGLTATGDPDQASRDKLVQVHGS